MSNTVGILISSNMGSALDLALVSKHVDAIYTLSRQVGSLRVAYTSERQEEFKKMLAVGEKVGPV